MRNSKISYKIFFLFLIMTSFISADNGNTTTVREQGEYELLDQQPQELVEGEVPQEDRGSQKCCEYACKICVAGTAVGCAVSTILASCFFI